MPVQLPRPSDSSISSVPNPNTNLKNSRCCFNFTKYETFVYIIGVFGIVASIVQIVFISMDIHNLHQAYPKGDSAYYMCGMGLLMATIVIVWEVPMLYFVNKRKLNGIQHWMFASLLLLIGSGVASVIAGGVFQREGLFLSMSFTFDFVRTPFQMFFVHKFVKSEKLDEDSHYIAAYYKKF